VLFQLLSQNTKNVINASLTQTLKRYFVGGGLKVQDLRYFSNVPLSLIWLNAQSAGPQALLKRAIKMVNWPSLVNAFVS